MYTVHVHHPQIYKEKKHHTLPPVSLRGQLLWREFFYTCAATTPNFGRMQGNAICKQIPWEDDPALLRAWEEGRTGFPWYGEIRSENSTQSSESSSERSTKSSSQSSMLQPIFTR